MQNQTQNSSLLLDSDHITNIYRLDNTLTTSLISQTHLSNIVMQDLDSVVKTCDNSRNEVNM